MSTRLVYYFYKSDLLNTNIWQEQAQECVIHEIRAIRIIISYTVYQILHENSNQSFLIKNENLFKSGPKMGGYFKCITNHEIFQNLLKSAKIYQNDIISRNPDASVCIENDSIKLSHLKTGHTKNDFVRLSTFFSWKAKRILTIL